MNPDLNQQSHTSKRPTEAGTAAKILFVEDDKFVREVLRATALEGGYDPDCAESAEAAKAMLGATPYDVVVTDFRLPGASGLDLLPFIGQQQPHAAAIVITAFGTIDIAVQAMKRGAVDFLTKPFTPDDLLAALRVALGRTRPPGASTGIASLKRQIVARSPAMLKLLDDVQAIAPFNTTVLLTGETGTGKELVARALHELSPRAQKAMVTLNCAAIPEQLLEDELFGHVKGAYTGAHSARPGRFERADGGTLFLDEIGDMALAMQSKLLRVLQEREFEKLGATRTTSVDVRVVAATSSTLEKRVERGAFRSDLYYRLNVIHFRIPPLRERSEDISPLASYFLEQFCSSTGLPQKTFGPAVRDLLHTYSWPGNVRQLQNAMERAAALTGGKPEITVTDLPEEIRSHPHGAHATLESGSRQYSGAVGTAEIPDEGVDFDALVSKLERDLLLQSLDKAGGNKMRAAQLLNMKRTTFIEKLKRLKISESSDPDSGTDGN